MREVDIKVYVVPSAEKFVEIGEYFGGTDVHKGTYAFYNGCNEIYINGEVVDITDKEMLKSILMHEVSHYLFDVDETYRIFGKNVYDKIKSKGELDVDETIAYIISGNLQPPIDMDKNTSYMLTCMKGLVEEIAEEKMEELYTSWINSCYSPWKWSSISNMI